MELTALRIDAQKQTLLALEQQLHEIDLEERRRQGEDRSYQSQIAELDQAVAVHRGDQEERGRLEAARSALLEASLHDARPALITLSQRHSELLRRLHVENEKLQALGRRMQTQ